MKSKSTLLLSVLASTLVVSFCYSMVPGVTSDLEEKPLIVSKRLVRVNEQSSV